MNSNERRVIQEVCAGLAREVAEAEEQLAPIPADATLTLRGDRARLVVRYDARAEKATGLPPGYGADLSRAAALHVLLVASNTPTLDLHVRWEDGAPEANRISQTQSDTGKCRRDSTTREEN